MPKETEIKDSSSQAVGLEEVSEFGDKMQASGEQLGEAKAKLQAAEQTIQSQNAELKSLKEELSTAKSYMIDNIKAAHAQVSNNQELSDSQKATFAKMESLPFDVIAMQLDFAQKTAGDFTKVAPAIVESHQAEESISEASANSAESQHSGIEIRASKSVPGYNGGVK